MLNWFTSYAGKREEEGKEKKRNVEHAKIRNLIMHHRDDETLMGFQTVFPASLHYFHVHTHLRGIFWRIKTSYLFLVFDLGSELDFYIRLLTDAASFVDTLL